MDAAKRPYDTLSGRGRALEGAVRSVARLADGETLTQQMRNRAPLLSRSSGYAAKRCIQQFCERRKK